MNLLQLVKFEQLSIIQPYEPVRRENRPKNRHTQNYPSISLTYHFFNNRITPSIQDTKGKAAEVIAISQNLSQLVEFSSLILYLSILHTISIPFLTPTPPTISSRRLHQLVALTTTVSFHSSKQGEILRKVMVLPER